jgi:uncharacterized protein (DUF2147 family)
MKKILSFFFIFSLFASNAFAESGADRLLGLWEVGSGKARVKISKYGEKYMGKIVWLKDPLNAEGKPKVDKNNPEESKRSVPLLGYVNMLGFVYKEENTWEEGTIYDPENGSTYSCSIQMPDENSINVRGFIGVSLLGRTDTWKRLVIKK